VYWLNEIQEGLKALTFPNILERRSEYLQRSTRKDCRIKQHARFQENCASSQPSQTQVFPPKAPITFKHLRTLGNAGHVGALVIGLTTSNVDTGPGPACARAFATGDNDVVAAAGNTTSDVVKCQGGDGDTSVRVTMKVTAIVVLLNKNAIPGTY
jgi:hypothetical protein